MLQVATTASSNKAFGRKFTADEIRRQPEFRALLASMNTSSDNDQLTSKLPGNVKYTAGFTNGRNGCCGKGNGGGGDSGGIGDSDNCPRESFKDDSCIVYLGDGGNDRRRETPEMARCRSVASFKNRTNVRRSNTICSLSGRDCSKVRDNKVGVIEDAKDDKVFVRSLSTVTFKGGKSIQRSSSDCSSRGRVFNKGHTVNADKDKNSIRNIHVRDDCDNNNGSCVGIIEGSGDDSGCAGDGGKGGGNDNSTPGTGCKTLIRKWEESSPQSRTKPRSISFPNWESFSRPISINNNNDERSTCLSCVASADNSSISRVIACSDQNRGVNFEDSGEQPSIRYARSRSLSTGKISRTFSHADAISKNNSVGATVQRQFEVFRGKSDIAMDYKKSKKNTTNFDNATKNVDTITHEQCPVNEKSDNKRPYHNFPSTSARKEPEIGNVGSTLDVLKQKGSAKLPNSPTVKCRLVCERQQRGRSSSRLKTTHSPSNQTGTNHTLSRQMETSLDLTASVINLGHFESSNANVVDHTDAGPSINISEKVSFQRDKFISNLKPYSTPSSGVSAHGDYKNSNDNYSTSPCSVTNETPSMYSMSCYDTPHNRNNDTITLYDTESQKDDGVVKRKAPHKANSIAKHSLFEETQIQNPQQLSQSDSSEISVGIFNCENRETNLHEIKAHPTANNVTNSNVGNRESYDQSAAENESLVTRTEVKEGDRIEENAVWIKQTVQEHSGVQKTIFHAKVKNTGGSKTNKAFVSDNEVNNVRNNKQSAHPDSSKPHSNKYYIHESKRILKDENDSQKYSSVHEETLLVRPKTSCGIHRYDAKLEKSAVYLRSRSRTFTRASQYMTGPQNTVRQLNVHYSQTNTGHNERIIFSDLLKSSHIKNTVVAEGVYAMERRLYNKRQDLARSTTFFDRNTYRAHDNASKSTSSARPHSSPNFARSSKGTGSQHRLRTVADKQKARRERIETKDALRELGYIPTMTTLEEHGPEEIEAILSSCRYLRVQPCRQPWLYRTQAGHHTSDAGNNIA